MAQRRAVFSWLLAAVSAAAFVVGRVGRADGRRLEPVVTPDDPVFALQDAPNHAGLRSGATRRRRRRRRRPAAAADEAVRARSTQVITSDAQHRRRHLQGASRRRDDLLRDSAQRVGQGLSLGDAHQARDASAPASAARAWTIASSAGSSRATACSCGS